MSAQIFNSAKIACTQEKRKTTKKRASPIPAKPMCLVWPWGIIKIPATRNSTNKALGKEKKQPNQDEFVKAK
jgi:hypothetical protein